MTIYVDNAGISADVTDNTTGRSYTSTWCHLFSDQLDPEELHQFAECIGLRRAWFQPGKSLLDRSQPDPVHDHYDVTAGKRRAAIRAGAIEVDMHEAVELWVAKRAIWRASLERQEADD